MKKLILYCSIDGNTDAVAHAIAEKIDADTARLVRVKKVRGFGFINNLKLRMEVMGKKKPDIFPFKWDPRDYDLIFIGTPVWYDSYNPVFNTLFNVIKIYEDSETKAILDDMAEWAQQIAEKAEKMIEQEEFERRKTIYKY